MSEHLLEVKHLKKSYPVYDNSGKLFAKKKHMCAVDDMSFFIEKGETYGLVGESGCGKSTTGRTIVGLNHADSGEILYDGKDLCKLSDKEFRPLRKDIQMVFQNPAESFDPRHTLGDGIGESLRNMGMNRRETNERVELLLEKCGLDKEFAQRYPHQVSGGQCQRAAIARALAVKPSILICDEATSALDVTVQKQILELLIELKHNENLTVLFISHDLALVQAFCDHVMVLNGGKMVEYGTTEQVIDHPKTDYTRTLIESVL